MPLDLRGQIAAAQLAFYVPIAVVCIALVIRYAFRRDAGWLFIFIFALTRIAGGALIVAAELAPSSPMTQDLYLAAYILFSAGLGVLMLATIGFIGLAGQHTYSERPSTSKALQALGVLALAGIALSIAGGLLGTHVNPNAATGLILRRAAAGVYGALFVLFILAHFASFAQRHYMRSYRRTIVLGNFLALPFVGARVAYAILDAWSAKTQFGTELSANSTLAQFNPISGKWLLFLILGLVVEFVACLIYVLFTTVFSKRHLRH